MTAICKQIEEWTIDERKELYELYITHSQRVKLEKLRNSGYKVDDVKVKRDGSIIVSLVKDGERVEI